MTRAPVLDGQETPRRRRSRLRRLVVRSARVVVLLVALLAALLGWTYVSAETDTAGKVAFERPLAIPPLAPSRVDDQGRRVFDLGLQQGSADLGQGQPTPTWGINGDYLGPTLRARRGEEVLVNVTNHVGEETTLHWHGMHLPARMDGGPHQMIAPGETWSPTWQVDQPAATLWYHPHLHGATADHVLRGLAGMFLLDDAQSRRLDLPHEYGVDDVPLVVQDRSFDDDGEMEEGARFLNTTGFVGDTVVVNGTVGPYLDVQTELVRLRVLNASNARIYNFGFDDDRTFAMVASDGGLLEAPHQTDRLLLSPGERAEIVVQMAPGEQTVLRSYPADLGSNFLTTRLAGGDDTLDIVQLRAAERLRQSPPLPGQLVDVPELDPAAAAATREFSLSGTQINGANMDMERIGETVALGTTEEWRVTNDDGQPHSFHVHDVQFQILDIAGAEPSPSLAGWKDTVLLRPGETARLVMAFSDYADPDRPYMFHCHLLANEDSGMMGQFVVVSPGDEAGSPPSAPHEHHG
ncbi:MAG: multicopper oxidase domain-containing protein [Nocardioidaceae bacterium]|nr:multicopper oxidase domain-containing protein [Nocardioidaceae bacterium]